MNQKVSCKLGRLGLLVCLAAVSLPGQYSPGINWRIIRSPHFEVVFPHEIEADAQRATNLLETFYGPMSDSFGVKPKRATVILANRTVVTGIGGSVRLMPLRSIWYTAAMQPSWGNNDWLTLMAAHEGRHLIQFRALNRGLNRLITFAAGDTGLGAATGWSIPAWYMEGDAKVAETIFTGGGQGRMAGSQSLTRSILLSGRQFSYMKAVHGSYKHAVPDCYEMGAFVVNRVNGTSGPDAWNRIVRRVTRSSFNPLAMSFAMKKETGRSAAATYEDAMSDLKERWSTEEIEMGSIDAPRTWNRARRSTWTGYWYPVYEPDGSVLAQKAGMAAFPIELVRLQPDGREETLFPMQLTLFTGTRTSVAAGRIVWDEYLPDLRWERSYSVLMVRDLATGRTRRLTHKSRLSAPVLSPSATRIAAVEGTPEGATSILILDAETGHETGRFACPDRDMLFQPAWSGDEAKIAYVRQNTGGEKALSVFEISSGKSFDLISPVREDLTAPFFYGDYVLYGSSWSGIDNIYAVDTKTGHRYQVTSSRFGAQYASVSADGHKLLYSSMSADGYDVAELPLDATSFRPLEEVRRSKFDYHGEGHDYTADMVQTAYRPEKYNPLKHLLGMHSWGMTAAPPELGFGVQSDDKMHLLGWTVGYKYDLNEGTGGFDSSAAFRRFYPVLDFGFNHRDRKTRFADHTSRWTEQTTRAGVGIPLNLSRGIYYAGLFVGTGIEWRRIGDGGLMPFAYHADFCRFRQSSARDLGPKWGQALHFSYRHTPRSDEYNGKLLSTSASLFVPGVARHHLLRVAVAHERRGNSDYYYSSELLFARGYRSVAGRNLTKASVDYALPLLYPDLALGPVAYLKRISANVFYEYHRVERTLYRSAGVEAHLDLGGFNLGTQLRAGVRYVQRFDFERGPRVEPFLASIW